MDNCTRLVLQALINRGVINDVKNLTSLNIKNENGNGAVKMMLYDLKVFNYLVMRLDKMYDDDDTFLSEYRIV